MHAHSIGWSAPASVFTDVCGFRFVGQRQPIRGQKSFEGTSVWTHSNRETERRPNDDDPTTTISLPVSVPKLLTQTRSPQHSTLVLVPLSTARRRLAVHTYASPAHEYPRPRPSLLSPGEVSGLLRGRPSSTAAPSHQVRVRPHPTHAVLRSPRTPAGQRRRHGDRSVARSLQQLLGLHL